MRIRRFFIVIFVMFFMQFVDAKTIVKYYQFSLPPQGVAYYRVTVPRGAKKIRAVIKYQTNQVEMKIYGPTGVVLCHSSTWSYMPNWQHPLECEVNITNSPARSYGVWKVMVKGAVAPQDLDKVSNVSGSLTIYIDVEKPTQPGDAYIMKKQEKRDTNKVIFSHEFEFSLAADGRKKIELIVPTSAKIVNISTVAPVQLKIFGPTNELLKQCPQDQAADSVRCSVQVLKIPRQRGGIWKLIILPDKNKTCSGAISGKLKVTIRR